MAKEDPTVRKVVPIDESKPEAKPSGRGRRTGGNPIHKARDFGKAAADTAAGAAKEGAKELAAGIMGVPGAAKGMIDSVLGKTAKSFGVSKGVAAAGIGVIGAFGGLGVVAGVSQYWNAERIYRQEGYVDDCAAALYDESQVQGETVSLEGDEMAYAEMMYGILANLGCDPKQCAGAVSSMAAESGLDPTAFEGIYTEKYQIGPKKSLYVDGNAFTPAIKDHFAWLQANTSVSLSVRGYTAENGQLTCGIGLLQYTGVGATGLMAMAESAGKMWYDFDVQMAYMMSDQSGFGARVRKYKEVSDGASASACADLWTQYVEMGGGSVSESMLSAHRAKADSILSQLGSRHEALQSEYSETASEVQELAGSNFQAATAARTSEVEAACGDGDGSGTGLDGIYDNTGMAKLMTMFCYQDYRSSEATATNGNPQKRGGTKLYQELRDDAPAGSKLKGDPYWNSCDRAVATAVISSGADDNFVLGGCSSMLAYLTGSDKWAKVGNLNDVKDSLEPGDILIYWRPGAGHVIMYTGSELNSAEGGSGEISSASYGERYPGMGSMRQHYTGSDNYCVFRYTGSFDGKTAFDMSQVKSPVDHH